MCQVLCNDINDNNLDSPHAQLPTIGLVDNSIAIDAYRPLLLAVWGLYIGACWLNTPNDVRVKA